MEYAHLSTRLMADAKSSCQQLETIAGLARTTTMPDMKVEDVPKVDVDVMTRLQQADRRYQPDVAAAAQQIAWDGEPQGMNQGSSAPSTVPLWKAQWCTPAHTHHVDPTPSPFPFTGPRRVVG